MWRVVAVVATGPCIDVNDAVRRANQVACMTDVVGEYGGAKAGRQLQPTVILRTCVVFGLRTTAAWVLRRCRRANDAQRTANGDSRQ